MARSGDGLGKKNSKLEAFLKKNLEADTFERIRVSDGCIVCSEKESKQFKFAVLTDEWIYLTENPPRKIYEEVHLSNIQSIELANDFPDFLVGDERENVQHVIIKHLAEFDDKGKKPMKSRTVSLWSARSDTSSSSISSSRSGILSTRSESALSSKYYKRRDSARLISARSSVTSQSFLSSPGKKSGKVKFDSASVADFRGSNKNSRSLDTRTLRELGIGSDNNNSTKVLSKNEDGIKTKKKSKKAKKGVMDEELQGELRINLSDLGENEENDDTMDGQPDYSDGSEDEDCLDLDSNIKTAVLHLYIMSCTSPFLTLLKGAWSNYIIKGTLEEDNDYCLKQMKFLPKTVPGLSERLELQFTQLRTELLNNKNSMEEIFHLVIELKNAAERQFFIKKMFWKSSELFHFLIRHLKKYLPTSVNVIDGFFKENQHRRADELEFVNLVVVTLYLMFRETEILSTRINTLKMGKGNLVKELIAIITSQPQIPGGANEAPSSLGTKLLKSKRPSFDLGQDNLDTELEKLCEELTDHSTALMFEIFLVAQQGTFQEDAMFFTVEWLVQRLEDLHTTPVFVERIIANLMNTVSPIEGDKPLNPAEAILLYHQLGVLEHILSTSPELLKYVQETFYEEFKYYIQIHVVRRKVPKYLVRSYILDLFTGIVSMVLGTDVRF